MEYGGGNFDIVFGYKIVTDVETNSGIARSGSVLMIRVCSFVGLSAETEMFGFRELFIGGSF